jgi:hypothetical protein
MHLDGHDCHVTVSFLRPVVVQVPGAGAWDESPFWSPK